MGNYRKEPLKKVQTVAMSHYARKDVQQAMFDFCKNRETIANFNNKFFAKRPDCFDYPSDILNSARQGATSFHCSEEIWDNPLDIRTDMTPEQYNKIKIGWDLLIDIDSKYLDYSKIAAKLLISVFKHHGIKNFGIKFSGSKGFHILIPFKAFPKEVQGEMTKDHFPDWARLIAGYLFENIREPMNKEIMALSDREKLKKSGELVSEQICPKCGGITEKKIVGKYICTDAKCRTKVESMKSNRKHMLCPSCNGKMDRVSEREIHFCINCKINTAKLEASDYMRGGEIRTNKVGFKTKDVIKSTEDSVDVVLVSSRHLFRVPYSLHEKTAFASIVLDKDDIDNFKPTDAEPMKIINTKPFMPDCKDAEAKDLLIQALEWGHSQKQPEKVKKYDGKIDIHGLSISEEMFPPIINKILDGIKTDGRKRALSLLLSFFSSLEFPQDFIEGKITEWNTKNYHPLKEGYIKSQISWYAKNKRLPPNYDKPIYKEFGIHNPPEPGMKNPINYTIKMAMKMKGKTKKNYSKPKKRFGDYRALFL